MEVSRPADDKQTSKSIFEFEGYVNDEEATERDIEAAIDPLWEKQQKRTFTCWCNLHLKKVGIEISAIEDDFRSGLNLLQLLEVISGEPLPKPEKGKMRVHRITNVNKALAFIQSKGVKLVSIAAEEIVDGNVKMTLGMIWTIILRFAIQDIMVEERSANEGLLLWCQLSTRGYDGVNVKNFNTSFKDGKAFCALINKYRPDLLDYDKIKDSSHTDILNTAFDAAATGLDIPKMLVAEDMLNSVKPDDLSVMAYVSCYYHAFAGARKASVAATRVCKAVELDQMSNQLQDEYSTIFSTLKEWIIKKKADLDCREQKISLAEAETLFQDFRHYQSDEKPPKIAEKARLETTFRTLQTRLRLNNRPTFLPQEGMLVVDIIFLWKELETCEKSYEEWLLRELKRMKNLEHWVRRFNVKCTTFEAWAAGKPEMLMNQDYKSGNIAEVRPMLKKHEAFESDLMAQQGRVERIEAIAQELQKLGYHDMTTINERCGNVKSSWESTKKLSDERRENLTKVLTVLEKIDALQLEIAKQSAPFNNWMLQAEEDLRDTFIAQSINEVEQLIKTHKDFEVSLQAKESDRNKIKQMQQEIGELNKQHNLVVQENPYANVTPAQLDDLWDLIAKLTQERQTELESAKQRQLANEELRKRFAALAGDLNGWLEKAQNRLNDIGLGTEGTMEEQVTMLAGMKEEMANKRPNLAELEECHQHLQEAFVFENTDSPVTMETLRSVWNQLLTDITFTENEVENQILTRDSKGLTKTQLSDMRQSFNHFDKDKSGRLDPGEFKACLVSVGHSVVAQEKGKKDMDRRQSVDMSDVDVLKLMDELDPNSSGFITFDVFCDYMTRELADMNNSDQLIESFKTMCGSKGYLTADDLRRELPSSQAEYCIQKMDSLPSGGGDTGALDFERYVVCIYGGKR